MVSVTVTVLTTVVIGDGENLGCRLALVADSEGTRGVEDLKAIQKVNKLQEILPSKDSREHGLHDKL